MKMYFIALEMIDKGLTWQSSGYDFTLHCRGCRLDPWSRSEDPTYLMAKKPEQQKEAIL